MREVLRKIAIHGGLTALILGIVGFMLAELASIWLAGSPGVRMSTGEPIETTDADGSTASVLHSRIPLLMAVWGFGFVAAGELLIHLVRRNRKPKATGKDAAEPDAAEKLLLELLAQAEAASRKGAEASDQEQTAGEQHAMPASAAQKNGSASSAN